MIRWKCPKCGSGKLGPARPRADASVRFCLDCSADAPRLVRRVAPALERKRAEKAERLAERAVERTARERRKRQVYLPQNIDLAAELRVMWRLPAIREARSMEQPPNRQPGDPRYHAARNNLPTLTIRRSPNNPNTSGRAWPGRRIIVTVGLRDDRIGVLVTLLHEVVHAALPRWVHHDQPFWAYLEAAAAEAFDGFAEAWKLPPRYTGATKYQRHMRIEDAARRAALGHNAPMRTSRAELVPAAQTEEVEK